MSDQNNKSNRVWLIYFLFDYLNWIIGVSLMILYSILQQYTIRRGGFERRNVIAARSVNGS